MFILSLSFFGINVHYSHLKKIKYIAVVSFGVAGCLGWVTVWLGFGWLTMAVISTSLLILSALSFLTALLIDYYVKT
ncbi:hypothetical protein V7201_02500 [Bacillus sp. JJ1122]